MCHPSSARQNSQIQFCTFYTLHRWWSFLLVRTSNTMMTKKKRHGSWPPCDRGIPWAYPEYLQYSYNINDAMNMFNCRRYLPEEVCVDRRWVPQTVHSTLRQVKQSWLQVGHMDQCRSPSWIAHTLPLRVPSLTGYPGSLIWQEKWHLLSVSKLEVFNPVTVVTGYPNLL